MNWRPMTKREITAPMLSWAVTLSNDGSIPIGTVRECAFGGVRVQARIVQHDVQERTGLHGTFHACELWTAEDGMKISTNGIKLIEREEGCVLHPYKDSHGFPTIGVGHLIRPGETWPATITQAQADTLLEHDCAEVEAACNRYVTVELSQNQFDALTCFAFNCGADELNPAHHSVVRILNTGNYQGAADELLLFDVSAGVHDPLLHARRARERALFLTPDGGPLPEEPHSWDLTTTKGLQRALNALGASPPVSVDGAFGAKTRAAVVAFQAAHHLVADGVPGPATRAALTSALAALAPT